MIIVVYYINMLIIFFSYKKGGDAEVRDGWQAFMWLLQEQ